DVVPGDLGLLPAAVDVAARDRETDVVAVFRDRVDQARALATAGRREAVVALADVPAIVAAARDDVDLLERRLTDVPDPEVAGLAVEAPAPGIAEADGIDLRAIEDAGTAEIAQRGAGERVARRDRVGRAERLRIDVDA